MDRQHTKPFVIGCLLAGVLAAALTPAAAQVYEAAPAPSATPTPTAPDGPVLILTDRISRAQANLIALRDGRLSTNQLTTQELQDVLDLERIARGRATTDNRSFSQRCVDDEVRRNGGNPTRLAWEVIRLKCQ